VSALNAEEWAKASERFAQRTEAYRAAQKREEAMAFGGRLLAGLALSLTVAALWGFGALTVKTLVLAVLGAFVLKKVFDYRRNTWCDKTIRDINERFPK
jgi:hypothetical protein